MGMLDDAMKDDARFAFANLDAFGESVTYTPVGGSAHVIVGVVVRGQNNVVGDVSALSYEVFIPHSDEADVGVDSVTIKDAIAIARQPGGTSVTMRVVEVIDQDNGMWHLRLQ